MQLVRQCGGMIDAGKAYSSASKLFIGSVTELSQYFQQSNVTKVRHGKFIDKSLKKCRKSICVNSSSCVCVLQESAAVGVALDKFAHVLTEIQKYHMVCVRNTIHI
jgi:hypothetical protein